MEEFFKEAFEGYDNIPENLENASREICTTFHIKGLADPVYIVNVIGEESGLGNTGKGFVQKEVSFRTIENIANRLGNSYRKVGVRKEKVEDILKTFL